MFTTVYSSLMGASVMGLKERGNPSISQYLAIQPGFQKIPDSIFTLASEQYPHVLGMEDDDSRPIRVNAEKVKFSLPPKLPVDRFFDLDRLIDADDAKELANCNDISYGVQNDLLFWNVSDGRGCNTWLHCVLARHRDRPSYIYGWLHGKMIVEILAGDLLKVNWQIDAKEWFGLCRVNCPLSR